MSNFTGLAAVVSNLSKQRTVQHTGEVRQSKSTDPEMEKVGLFLHAETLESAFTRFKRDNPRVKGSRRVDRSDLVNKLLSAYASKKLDL